MKGISPLVASVLLIAITMSVAGILAFWVSSYTSQTLPKFNRTEECRFSNFVIYGGCRINTTTNTLNFMLHNIGQYEILDLVAYVITTDNNVISIKLNSSLGIAELKSFTLTDIPAENFSKLVVGTTACPDLTKEEFCARV